MLKFNLQRFGVLLCFIWLLLTPLPIFGRRTINIVIDTIFTIPTRWLRQWAFADVENFDGFFTDSLNYGILLFWGLLLSLTLYILINQLNHKLQYQIFGLVHLSVNYFLSWIIMVYAFSKFYGIQFPEILAEQFDSTWENRDILFWSWMGGQKVLVIAVGAAELLIALLLWFPRTRKRGIVFSLIALSIILLLNVIFNLGVLIFAMLMMLSSFVLYCDAGKTSRGSDYFFLNIYKPLKLGLVSTLLILAAYHYEY
jgi:hypothetical protein